MRWSAASVLLAKVDDMAVSQKKAQDLGDPGLWVDKPLAAFNCSDSWINATCRLLASPPSTAVPRPTSHIEARSS
jgi:hypothetical protein